MSKDVCVTMYRFRSCSFGLFRTTRIRGLSEVDVPVGEVIA